MEAVFQLLVVKMSHSLEQLLFSASLQIFYMTRDNITWFLHTYIINSSIFATSQLLVVKMSWGKIEVKTINCHQLFFDTFVQNISSKYPHLTLGTSLGLSVTNS